MFLAHLPAGYILTTRLQKRLNTPRFLWIGLASSLVPDLDLVYFYLFDQRATLHHLYWPHVPIYWLGIFIPLFLIFRMLKLNAWIPALLIAAANIFLHLILDTVVGKIAWFYPLAERSFYLFDVPARYVWWVWNFILHWTFLLEIVIVVIALVTLLRRSSKQTPNEAGALN